MADNQSQEETVEVRTFLSRGSFMRCKLRTDEVQVSELGGWVKIREISLADFDAIESHVASLNESGGQLQFRARVIIAGVIDQNGDPLFRDSDVELVSNLSSKLANKIVNAITGLSLISTGAVEEEIKN